MKTSWLALTLTLLVTSLPGSAHAGCPQAYGKCLAVVELEVALEDAPDCVRVGNVEPENGCVCDGTFTITNDCTFALTSSSFAFAATTAGAEGGDPNVPAGKQSFVTVRGGKGQMFPGVVSMGAEGEHDATLELEAAGTPFAVNIMATVAERGGDGGCSLGNTRQSEGALPLGALLTGLALAILRRRR